MYNVLKAIGAALKTEDPCLPAAAASQAEKKADTVSPRTAY